MHMSAWWQAGGRSRTAPPDAMFDREERADGREHTIADGPLVLATGGLSRAQRLPRRLAFVGNRPTPRAAAQGGEDSGAVRVARRAAPSGVQRVVGRVLRRRLRDRLRRGARRGGAVV